MESSQIQLVTQMTFIQNEFERYMRKKMKNKNIEITRVRFGILHQINQTGSLHQQLLADWNNITPQAVHRHVKLLEESGYLKKKPGRDARSYEISLTPSGKKLISESEKILVTAVKEFFKNLSIQEVETITKLLSKVKTFDISGYCK
ncbi:MAG: DNA-binding MarR family transcriptional regulator [Crocinitomicaceae bacterium]|jgi:DNA-binding MarR family transcriptional regulator